MSAHIHQLLMLVIAQSSFQLWNSSVSCWKEDPVNVVLSRQFCSAGGAFLPPLDGSPDAIFTEDMATDCRERWNHGAQANRTVERRLLCFLSAPCAKMARRNLFRCHLFTYFHSLQLIKYLSGTKLNYRSFWPRSPMHIEIPGYHKLKWCKLVILLWAFPGPDSSQLYICHTHQMRQVNNKSSNYVSCW